MKSSSRSHNSLIGVMNTTIRNSCNISTDGRDMNDDRDFEIRCTFSNKLALAILIMIVIYMCTINKIALRHNAYSIIAVTAKTEPGITSNSLIQNQKYVLINVHSAMRTIFNRIWVSYPLSLSIIIFYRKITQIHANASHTK